MSRYLLTAYNNIRKRSLDDCSSDLAYLIEKLGILNPSLFRWKPTVYSKSKAMSSVYIDGKDVDSLKKIVGKGVNRRDDTKEIISDLGFRASFWNGVSKDEEAAALSVINGGYNPAVQNNVVLKFPEFNDLGINDILAQSILQYCVNAIDAEWALLYRDVEGIFVEDEIFLDRGVYLRKNFSNSVRRKLEATADSIISLSHGEVFLRTV